MQLIFKLKKTKQKGRAPIEVILKKKREVIGREEVKNAEKILEGLDKILKKSKVKITAIKAIKVDDLNKNSYTSYRIIKAVEKALKLGLNFKLSKKLF